MGYDANNQAKPILWIVIPCYNEQDVLPVTSPLFAGKMAQLVADGKVSPLSRVCFIDDGSTDSTWEIISNLAKANEGENDSASGQKASAANPASVFVGVKLSRNRGHQNALLAGLMEAREHCDAAVSIDCDGQDDLNAIDAMVDNFLAGDDIVYGVRSSRDTDTKFKRSTAESFYRLMNVLGAETVYNHADFRLFSKKALDALAEYGESNLFLRGMAPLIGLPSSTVEYARAERAAGTSHYPFRKMLALALDGITSMSVKPIRIVSGLGLLFSLLGLVGIIWAIVSVVTGSAISGWASTIVLVSLIGGIQLLSLGVIGEYVGKIYLETKARPRYLIQERTWAPEPRHYRG